MMTEDVYDVLQRITAAVAVLLYRHLTLSF